MTSRILDQIYNRMTIRTKTLKACPETEDAFRFCHWIEMQSRSLEKYA